MAVKYATETASIAMPDGSTFTVKYGQPYPADHPAVVRCPGWFSDGLPADELPVETATAVPGERRSARRG